MANFNVITPTAIGGGFISGFSDSLGDGIKLGQKQQAIDVDRERNKAIEEEARLRREQAAALQTERINADISRDATQAALEDARTESKRGYEDTVRQQEWGYKDTVRQQEFSREDAATQRARAQEEAKQRQIARMFGGSFTAPAGQADAAIPVDSGAAPAGQPGAASPAQGGSNRPDWAPDSVTPEQIMIAGVAAMNSNDPKDAVDLINKFSEMGVGKDVAAVQGVAQAMRTGNIEEVQRIAQQAAQALGFGGQQIEVVPVGAGELAIRGVSADGTQGPLISAEALDAHGGRLSGEFGPAAAIGAAAAAARAKAGQQNANTNTAAEQRRAAESANKQVLAEAEAEKMAILRAHQRSGDSSNDAKERVLQQQAAVDAAARARMRPIGGAGQAPAPAPRPGPKGGWVEKEIGGLTLRMHPTQPYGVDESTGDAYKVNGDQLEKVN